MPRFSKIVFSPSFFSKVISQRLPVHSNNFSDKFRTKFLSIFSLKLMLIFPSENLIKFNLSNSYFNLISFFFEVRDIKSSIDEIRIFGSLLKTFSEFKDGKIVFVCIVFFNLIFRQVGSFVFISFKCFFFTF